MSEVQNELFPSAEGAEDFQNSFDHQLYRLMLREDGRLPGFYARTLRVETTTVDSGLVRLKNKGLAHSPGGSGVWRIRQSNVSPVVSEIKPIGAEDSKGNDAQVEMTAEEPDNERTDMESDDRRLLKLIIKHPGKRAAQLARAGETAQSLSCSLGRLQRADKIYKVAGAWYPSESMILASASPSDNELITAILNQLPPVGTAWSDQKRTAWLSLMASAFEYLYDDDK